MIYSECILIFNWAGLHFIIDSATTCSTLAYNLNPNGFQNIYEFLEGPGFAHFQGRRCSALVNSLKCYCNMYYRLAVLIRAITEFNDSLSPFVLFCLCALCFVSCHDSIHFIYKFWKCEYIDISYFILARYVFNSPYHSQPKDLVILYCRERWII